jgi:transmembrane sensor
MRAGMDNDARKSEHVEEAAARWFARRQSGTWTDADQAGLDAWLEADTAHRIQYVRVASAWDQCARMQALGAGVTPGVVPPRGSWGDGRFFNGTSPQIPPPAHGDGPNVPDTTDFGAAIPTPLAQNSSGRNARRRRFFTAAAAMFVLAIGGYFFRAGLTSGTHYSTPVGGMNELTLADGSHVTLNTDTSIRVSLTERERRIRLERGEAFFDVAKNPSRPFVVYAGDKRVMAVGTKFAVRREHDDVQVVVLEGRVNLSASAQQALVTTDAAPRDGERTAAGAGVSIPPPTSLVAGAIARTSKSEVLVRPDAASEAEKLLSWRRGYLSFDNLTLAAAVAEFNRYNTRQIVIDAPAIASLRIGGSFRANNIDAFLDLMQSGFPIAVEHDGDTVVLRQR